MNGIEPPSPMYIAGLPKKAWLASSMAWVSHGAIAGAFQPVEAFSRSRVTCAPFGGSRSSASFNSSPQVLPSAVGGRRSDSFTEVCGRSTLPADSSGGMPPTPVTDRAGRQVRLSTSSVRSSFIGRRPSTIGNFSKISVSTTSAARLACSRRSAGISTFMPSIRMRPVSWSSMRDSSWRSRRKLDGTTPEASPECTPSLSTFTVKLPPVRPRSEVVHHSWS